MRSTATLTDYGGGGSPGELWEAIRTPLWALVRNVRRIIPHSKDTLADRRRAATRHGTADTRVVDAVGNLRDTRVLQVFHRRCEGALNPAPRRVVVDLAGVTSADTKLVATLVLLRRRAHSEGVPLELTVSSRVYGWIALCQAEHLLRPACAKLSAAAGVSAPGKARGQERSGK